MLDQTDTTADAAPPAETAAPKRSKAVSSYDAATKTLTIISEPGAEPQAFSLAAVPQAIREHFEARGFATFLANGADTPAEAYARLMRGDFAGPRKPKVRELDPWRLAIAHAAVEQTRKSDAPLTLDDAKARAAGVTRDALADAKRNPAVVKHYDRLTRTNGAAPADVTALFG